MFGWNRDNQGTFRPVKKIPKEHRNYRLQEISRKTLGAGDLATAVKLPPGEKLDDWLAMNVVEFYNQLSCLYAPIAEHCTNITCPKMTAGPGFQYYWQDNERYKKPTMLPAPEYITNVMAWTESFINDEKVFPCDPNVPFPPEFRGIVANIFKRLFRIYAHIYHHHRNDVIKMGGEAHLDTSFRHFALFCKEFKLIPEDQMKPLEQIMASF
ncbi:Mob1/phocein family protein [Tritrichomonas foetus]|uniref:Mob1/phocein family protein n=1 Tax=Tritrichomonas foetus TaxID=1144522 RepID=A0A1J4KXR7_9EUKA|nr:Mob1/phocein family protein [Tritrichomonas foetus]|eukprot:OHT16049.1 Mob1/phocein family protein [Tritrichomonas foetus]